jgi:hypothetical protein
MKNPQDDVHLSNGDGFMVKTTEYKEHLRVAKEIKQVGLVKSSPHADRH